MTQILRLALSVLNVPFCSLYTMHSLRRGAAVACHSLGIPLEALKAHGTWASSAVYSYIPRKAPRDAPEALASLFGRASGAVVQV